MSEHRRVTIVHVHQVWANPGELLLRWFEHAREYDCVDKLPWRNQPEMDLQQRGINWKYLFLLKEYLLFRFVFRLYNFEVKSSHHIALDLAIKPKSL